jgi:hypothetical protein
VGLSMSGQRARRGSGGVLGVGGAIDEAIKVEEGGGGAQRVGAVVDGPLTVSTDAEEVREVNPLTYERLQTRSRPGKLDLDTKEVLAVRN